MLVNCTFTMRTCAANVLDNRCSALRDTKFRKKTVCPFYKDREQWASELTEMEKRIASNYLGEYKSEPK